MKVQYIILNLLLLCGTLTYAQTRIQTARGNTGANTAGSFTVTLNTAPQPGNTLIAVISGRTTTTNNASLSQTNVSWTRAVARANTVDVNTEIFYTTAIGENAGTVITITNASNIRCAAVVMEYTGLLYGAPLDLTASNHLTNNNATATTGTTGTTTVGPELWIGGIGVRSSSYTLTNITNSFTNIETEASTNNTATNNARIFVLERSVTTRATASSGGTVSTSSRWAGAIATFKRLITGFTPGFVCSNGSPTVTITGEGFTGATAVKFNGVDAASFTVNSNTQITATVPTTATSGLISVTTAAGTGYSESPLIVRQMTQPTGTISNTSCPATTDGAITLNNIPTALNFISTQSQWVTLGSPLLSGLSAFTLEGWIKTTSYNRNSFFGQDNAIEFGFTSTGAIELWSEGLNTNLLSATDTYPRDGEWHHIAGVGDGQRMYIYIDGKLEVSVSHGALPTARYGTSTINSVIGGYVWATGTPNFFNGQMLKVSFWNRALSATEIVNLASGPYQYSVSDNGLIAGYNFFEGTGTSLSRIPGGTAGTITGSPASTWTDLCTYSWTKQGGGYTASTKNATGIGTGTYDLTVTIAGCTSNSNSFVVASDGTESTAATSITGTTPVCSGTQVALSLVDGTLGTGASWRWYSGACGTNEITTGLSNGNRTLTITPSSTTTYYARAEGTCNTTACVSFTVTVNSTGSWLGTTSTDWNTSSNWCGGVPTSTTDVLIPTTPVGNRFPHVGSAGAVCKSLTIETGASVTMEGAYIFDLYGNWINNGTFNASTSTVNIKANGTVSGSSTTTFHNLTIGTGQTLTGSSSTMNLTGNFTNNGTYTNNGGTIEMKGASAQEINGSTIFYNLTIDNTAGVVGKSDFTVNGVLNLKTDSPNDSIGTIEMTIDYGAYSNVITETTNLTTTQTQAHDLLNSNILYMGANATTIGIGDVTGKVKRDTINENIEYSLGNKHSTITFNKNSSGVLPTAVMFIITKGPIRGLHANKTNTVARLYQVIRTGGSLPTSFTLKLHYKDSELNNNTEGKLVLWDHHIKYTSANTPHEHGKTAQDTISNWVELSGHGVNYLGDQEYIGGFTKYWMFSNTLISNNQWLGNYSSTWKNPSNWTKGWYPKTTDIIEIPVTANNPVLPTDTVAVAKSVTIREGASLHGGTGTLKISGGIATNGGPGSWNNYGTFIPGTSTVIFDYPRVDSVKTATITGEGNFYNMTIENNTYLVVQAGSTTTINNDFTQTGYLDARTYTNTFSYNGDGAQDIVNPSIGNGYHNLTLSGSGTKTLPSSNLNISGKLLLNAPFTAISNTITFDGTTPQTLSGTSTSALNSLTIKNSNGLTLGKNQTLEGTLTLTDGLITTGTNLLTLECGTTTSGEKSTSYVNGILVREYCTDESKLFPIGKGGKYRPLTITRSGGTTNSSTIQSEQFESTITGTLPANTTAFADRFWKITQPTGSYTYAIQIDGTDFTPNGTAVILKGNGSTIEKIAATTPNYTTATSVSSFSDFTLGSECLPPSISSHPSAATGCELSSTINFTVAAIPIGEEIFTYSWEVNTGSGWTTLSNGGVYSGSTTATLTITNPPYSMHSSQYRALVSRPCGGTVNSNAATLTLNPLPQGGLSGQTNICKGEVGYLTWTATLGAGPFTLIYNAGGDDQTVNNVVSGTPFSVGAISGTTTFTLVSVANSTCTRTSDFTTGSASITVNPYITWNGTTSTDWFTASNWCGGVPTINDDVIIPSSPTGARFPVIAAEGAVCHSLILQNSPSENSPSLSINGAYTLTVSGNFTNNDTIIIDMGTVALTGFLENNSLIRTKNSIPSKSPFDGTIEYNGTSPQTLIDNATYNNLIINNASGVSLPAETDISATLLTIEAGAFLEIGTKRAMTATTINNKAGTSGLWIRSAADQPNGSLIFHNTSETPVNATVEMFSKAFKSETPVAGTYYKWQYFGIPIQSLATASPTFDGSYVRRYNPSGKIDLGGSVFRAKWEALTNDSSLRPFEGYEITHNTARTITFKGVLENRDFLRDANDPLINYPGAAFPGQYIFANPYTAAIDITQLSFGEATEATVYLYNTGSYGDWETAGNGTTGSAAGQYVAIPKAVASITPEGLTSQIPSMQGFLIRKLANVESPESFTLEILYNSVITKSTTAQRAPRQSIDSASPNSSHATSIYNPLPGQPASTVDPENNGLPYTIIDIKGNQFSDRLWMFTHVGCCNRFDNGWDGEKLVSNQADPRLFALMPDRDYQVFTTNNIHNTTLGFVPGNDTQYELNFKHFGTANCYPEGIFLEDLTNGSLTNMSANNASYLFRSSATDPVKRFRIRIGGEARMDDETDELLVYTLQSEIVVSNFSSTDQLVTLYDIMGHSRLSVLSQKGSRNRIPTQLQAGVYIAQFSSGKTFKIILK